MSIVKNKIIELTDKLKLFTAYDVTISLRNDGHHIEHVDVKKEINDLFNNNDFNPNYTREVITIQGNTAWLYKTTFSTVDDYLPFDKTYDKVPNSQPIKTNIRNKQPVDDSLLGCFTDKKNRLNIPKKLINKLFKSNDVYIVCDKNSIKLFNKDKRDSSYMQMKNGSIRLPGKVTDFLNTMNFDIVLESDHILIKGSND